MAASPARELSSIDFESMLGGPLVAVVNAQAKAAMSSVNFIKTVGFESGTSEDPLKPDTGKPIYVTFEYDKEVAPYQPAIPATLDPTVAITKPGTGLTEGPHTLPLEGEGGSGGTVEVTVTGGVITAVKLVNPGSGYTKDPIATLKGSAAAKNGVVTAKLIGGTKAQPPQIVPMKLKVPILTMLPIPFIRIEETTIDFNAKINSVEESTTDSTFKGSMEGSGKYAYPPLFSIASVKMKVSTSYQKNTSSGSRVERTYSMAVHIRAVQDELPAGLERILGILEDAISSTPPVTPTP